VRATLGLAEVPLAQGAIALRHDPHGAPTISAVSRARSRSLV